MNGSVASDQRMKSIKELRTAGDVGTEGAEDVFRALKCNTTLTKLDLRGNDER